MHLQSLSGELDPGELPSTETSGPQHTFDGSDALHILDTVPQQTFDDFARIAAAICGASMAMVLLLDRGSPVLKAHVGIAPERLPSLLSLCTTAPLAGDPATFLARIPWLAVDGEPLATVCVLDDEPRQLSETQQNGLAALARQASGMLERRHRALEVKRLLAEREYLHRRMEGHQCDLERRNDELRQLATHDALTGLWNRGALEDLIGSPDSAARLFADHYTIAMLDVDHFKRVNDTHVHPMGDEALRRVGAVIAECRTSTYRFR